MSAGTKRLVIKGSEWERGGWHGDAYLYATQHGTYCCLGLHARLCGVDPEHMADIGEPDDLEIHARAYGFDLPREYTRAWVTTFGGAAADHRSRDAIAINDGAHLTDEQRIEKLRPLFREVGVTLVWRPDL